MVVWRIPKLRVRSTYGGNKFSPGSHFGVINPPYYLTALDDLWGLI